MFRRVVVWLPLVAAVLVNELGTLSGNLTVGGFGQMAIMPAVAVAATLLRGRWRLGTVIGFALYWIGDTAPRATPGSWRDLVMLALFMMGHVTLIAATRERLTTARRRARTVMFTSMATSFVVVVLSIFLAWWLTAWIAMYAATLTILATRLSGFSRAGTWGGLALLVSNCVLALRIMVGGYGQYLPRGWQQVSSSITMLLYALALALISWATVVRAPEPAHDIAP